jgi:hypothetical protein
MFNVQCRGDDESAHSRQINLNETINLESIFLLACRLSMVRSFCVPVASYRLGYRTDIA